MPGGTYNIVSISAGQRIRVKQRDDNPGQQEERQQGSPIKLRPGKFRGRELRTAQLDALKTKSPSCRLEDTDAFLSCSEKCCQSGINRNVASEAGYALQ